MRDGRVLCRNCGRQMVSCLMIYRGDIIEQLGGWKELVEDGARTRAGMCREVNHGNA